MAPSIIPDLRCALCKEHLDPLAPHFRATGSFLPPADPLTPYVNAPLHWSCYARWESRERFAQHFVAAWIKANHRNPFWWKVLQTANVYVCVNPERPIEEASVRLTAVGSDIRVPLTRWAEWLAAPERVTPNLQPLELEHLRDVLPMLRTRFPDDYAVVHAIDPQEKQPRTPERLRARGVPAE